MIAMACSFTQTTTMKSGGSATESPKRPRRPGLSGFYRLTKIQIGTSTTVTILLPNINQSVTSWCYDYHELLDSLVSAFQRAPKKGAIAGGRRDRMASSHTSETLLSGINQHILEEVIMSQGETASEPTPISATELRTQTRDILERARFQGEYFVVYTYGKAMAALVSLEEFENLRRLKDGKKATP